LDVGSLIDGATIVCTGGSGTLGQALVTEILARYHPRKVVVFSRSESRQATMKARFPENGGPLRYFVGDVRSKDRLLYAFDGAGIVIHAAALKRVEVCEREPFEAIQTNVIGTLNAIEAARACGVERFLFVSSDKATAACTLYGGTKYVAERATIAANSYSGARRIRYSAVRYGNVLGSTGSVLHTFAAANGKVPITDVRMSRFFLTPCAAACFCLSSLALMRGGEVFVPKLPAMRIADMARVLAPDSEQEVIGLRGAEKLAEAMLSVDESPWVVELADRYALLPTTPYWPMSPYPDARPVPGGFSYTSDTAERLTPEQLREMVNA
jgi:UDP-N-acetylglucosamine 4,6-dehydratase/5-epimerase